MTLDRNDPRWTAYVLDELEPEARVRFEAEMARDPEAAAILAETREALEVLGAAFSETSPATLTDTQREEILAAASPAPVAAAAAGRRFRNWTLAAGLAASLLIGVVTLQVVRNVPDPAGSDDFVAAAQQARVEDTAGADPDAVEASAATPELAPAVAVPPSESPAAVESASPAPPSTVRTSLGRATLSGTVTDETSQSIPGVEITATNVNTGVESLVFTNQAGAFSIPNLQTPSRYELRAELPGMTTQVLEGIRLGSNETLRFNMTMGVAEATEPVEVVTDMSTRLAVSSPTVSQVLDQTQVTELPLVGDEVLELIRTMAEVRGNTNSEETTFAGIDPSSVNTVRDGLGVSNVQSANGVFRAGTINPDLVSEVGQPLTVLDAEFGRAAAEPARTDQNRTQFNTEEYDRITDNAFRLVADEPLATFSVDVDTASYANVRRFLNQRTLPPPDAVRIEEMVNYFRYDYAPPVDGRPVRIHAEVAAAPWRPEHRLVRIGIQGEEIEREARASNLVFLIDVSGSMDQPDKLPLLVDGMKLLVEQLGENDRVAIVVYAGASGLVLDSTPGFRSQRIMAALDRLRAGGSTNGGAGIELAYEVAVRNFIDGGINRVILATDGDFNVGVTNNGDLTRLIEERAETGVFLSVLGFGSGNLNDAGLEALADRGNGNYAYIDTIREARKVLVEEIGATLVTIAKDVKIQIEFNPLEVAAYRLIGYENRVLQNQDFADDTVDAGEIGSGHTVTALFEVVPVGVEFEAPGTDPLRYQQPLELSDRAGSGELLTVAVRYKAPDGDVSQLIESPVIDRGQSFEAASVDQRFAAAVAGFGMLLRDSPYRGSVSFDDVVRIGEGSLGEDAGEYRQEFVELVRRARAIRDLN